MPWTLAHPAAVVPLLKWRGGVLPAIGLVVGSLSPDFGLYVFRHDFSKLAHTPLGILLFCIPVSLVVVAVLGKLWNVLAAPLPEPHRTAVRGIARPRLGTLRGFVGCAVACGLGAATHLLWDAFTHANTVAVEALPFLRVEVFSVAGRTFRVYQVLQHASTAAGLMILVVVYARWINRLGLGPVAAPDASIAGHLPWLACAGVAAALGLYGAYLSLGEIVAEALVVRSVIFACCSFVALYGMLAVTMALLERRSGP